MFSTERPQSTDTTGFYGPYKSCFLENIPGLCAMVAHIMIHFYYDCPSEGLCVTCLVTDHLVCSQTLLYGHYKDLGDTFTVPKVRNFCIQSINCSQNPLAILSYGLSATEKHDSWIHECNISYSFYHT